MPMLSGHHRIRSNQILKLRLLHSPLGSLLCCLKIVETSRHLDSSKRVHLQRISSWDTHRSFLLHLHLHENLIHHVLVVRTSLSHCRILLMGSSVILLFLNLSHHYLLKLRLGHLAPLNSFLMPLNLLYGHLWLLVISRFTILVFVLIFRLIRITRFFGSL